MEPYRLVPWIAPPSRLLTYLLLSLLVGGLLMTILPSTRVEVFTGLRRGASVLLSPGALSLMGLTLPSSSASVGLEAEAEAERGVVAG